METLRHSGTWALEILYINTIIVIYDSIIYFLAFLGTGPVTYRSGSERSLFVSDIDGLRASGGGDCPELAFTGMLNALEEGPEYGSPMFVFTDASAKDANSLNKAALKASADLSDITITFFTNLNGCSATDGIKDYEEIARHTEGKSTSSLIRIAYTLPGKC